MSPLRPAVLSAALLGAHLAWAAPAAAAAAGPYTPAAGAPLTDPELAEIRGGYITVGGVTLDFGAVTRTLVDGRLALQTELTWTAAGAHIVQTGGDPSALRPDGAGGVAFVTPDGRSMAVQSLTPTGLANMVTNTASNRAIAQDTAVTLTLPGFQAVQGRMSDVMAASRLAQTVNDALVAYGRR